MADLAKLVVRLEAQSSQLLTELDKVSNRLNRFEKNAAASLDKLDKKFSKFGFGVKASVAAILGGFSFNAILKATTEASDNFANLENAVERAGDAAGGRTARDFAEISTQLSNITTQSDDAIQGVQQLLLRFQSIRTDRFDDATKSALNLSTALRKDLQSSAELVGKALNDPIKGMTLLARSGVTFSEAQQKVIKNLVETGRQAEAQGIILDKLEQRFGGAAEAARGTFGGALTAVKNALGDLMEADGGLPQATDSLNGLAKILQDPSTKAAADALFSVIIRGAVAAAKFIAETVAGLQVLLGFGANIQVNLSDKIIALEDSLKSLRAQNPFPDAFAADQIARRTEEIKKLYVELEKLQNLGTNRTKPKGDGTPKGAELLPDILVIDGTTEALDKLQQKLEAQGKALTEKLQQPLEKYNAATAEADRLLTANVISIDTWARALGAAREELEGLSTGMLEVEERLQTIDTILEKNTQDLKARSLKAFEEQAETDAKKLGEVLKKQEKELSVFAEEAARNTQDILADGLRSALHDGIDEGAEGALEAFADMLEKMALQAIAADIAGKIFGEDGKGGGWLDRLGGLFGGNQSGSGGQSNIVQGDQDWWGDLFGGSGGGWLSAIGSIFGSRDNGGRGAAGVPVAIGRGAQPELFVPDVPGEFYPAGTWSSGGQVTQNIYTSSPMTQRTARQLELEAAKRQRTTTARMG